MLGVVVAVLHYLLALVMVSTLVAQLVIFRLPLNFGQARTLLRLDGWYGVAAATLAAVGVVRATYLYKGEPYFSNGWFLTKLVLFAFVGLVSLPPMISFSLWNAKLKHGGELEVSSAQEKRIRLWLVAGLVGIAGILISASLAKAGYWRLR